jgi:ferredoxin
MAAKTASIQIARRIILGVSLAGLTLITVLHQRNPAFPSIDALDPFGGLETLMKFAAGGELIKKIMPGNLVLLGAIVVLGVVLSRFFCGWFCALGALQGVFGWIGRKIFRRRLEVPRRLDAVLRWAKYPLLAAIVYLTWRAGDLVIRPYDPLAAYGHLAAGIPTVWAEFGVGLVILVAVLVLSMLYERVFCKYLCPLGAVNAILSRIPLFRIKREASTCISCSKCDRVCPMNIEVSTASSIDSSECIACMECVTACPTKKSTLAPKLGGRALKAGFVAAIGIGIYLAAALVGQGLGMLSFSGPTLARQAASGALKVEDIKGSSTWKGAAIPAPAPAPAPTAKAPLPAAPQAKPAPTGEAALSVPADFALEGTMSVKDVALALGASASAVIAKLGLPADIPQDQPLKDMKDRYGYTMPALRERLKQ